MIDKPLDQGNLIVAGHVITFPATLEVKDGCLLMNGQRLPRETEVALEQREFASQVTPPPKHFDWLAATHALRGEYYKSRDWDAAIEAMREVLRRRGSRLRLETGLEEGQEVIEGVLENGFVLTRAPRSGGEQGLLRDLDMPDTPPLPTESKPRVLRRYDSLVRVLSRGKTEFLGETYEVT